MFFPLNPSLKMLYQSLPLFFHFQPSATTLLRPSQREKEMECVEFTALKSSFWDEMMVAGKSTQQALSSEVWVGNGAGEDFFVDDLLDLSNEEEEEEKGSLASVSSVGEEARFDAAGENANYQAGLPLKEEFVGISSSELAVPTDDIAELEWLSNFVDESFSEFPCQTHPLPFQATPTGKPETETRNREWGFDIDKTRIPAKARSKRHRAAPRVRRLGGHADHEPPTSSSSSSTSSSYPPPCLILANTGQNEDHLLFHCVKKPDSKKWRRGGKEKAGAAGVQRRCSHCLVQKTPQWRAGPLGSKTLCNACGVRFKSGRLLPEYRPAGSPTFMSAVHSNSHRKVLEMRRKREEVGSDEPARRF